MKRTTTKKEKFASGVINYRHEQERAQAYFAEIHKAVIAADEDASCKRDLVYDFAEKISDLRVAVEELVSMAEVGTLEVECMPTVIRLFKALGKVEPKPGLFQVR